ncbi:carboxypeptidase regulatory-like domain-containing protein [Corallococcus sp. CA049B]|uniref:carboxypeptidase-like regulatory domain-containing protein n=1 Tax=Corallococcus sp. CA049B TaxID=2316730 RepID=UPI000EA31728|nr:carboxypeptidase-like regulatory domain-containing protein [Corallococcus sp. CA049B]RKG85277.1 carboxypeptidase regulatory-like domain-containing protein [Corallococcus sp. CA049B]
MRWSWVGLLAVVLACAEAPRPVQTKTRWPMEEVAFTVRTVDPAGQPVPGVALVARRADQGSLISRSGTSDATGTVRLRVMPGWYVVQAEAPGFVRMLHTDARIPPGEEVRLELTLTRTAPFAGRVVDLEGRPVAGAQLRLTHSGDEEAVLHTESDGDGRFRFDNVPAGAVKLLAEKEEWSPTRLKLAAPQPELTVVMGGLGSLRVQVRRPDGTLSSAASSSIYPEDKERFFELVPEQRSDATVFQGLPAGRYRVSGRYGPPSGDCVWTRGIEVQVLPGQQAEATVSFEGILDVGPWRGVAVDASGKALAPGQVTAWLAHGSLDDMGLHGRCDVRSEPDGSFAFPHVFQAPVSLEWSATPSTMRWFVDGPLPRGAGEPATFRPIIGLLKGRVLRPDGQAQTHFKVHSHSEEDPRGEYEHGVPTSHTYQWVIEAEGFAPALVRAEGREHEILTVPDVVLDVGRTVHGHVVAEDGKTGVPGQEVALLEVFDLETRWRRRPHTVTTGADGHFQFDHVAGRRLFLRVDAKAQGTVLRGLEPDEVSVQLRLVPGAELEGFVTEGARVPLAGVNLEVRCEGGFKVDARTDAMGHYSVRVPANRPCFMHAEASPLNVMPRPLPPRVFFSPRRIHLAPASHHRLDFEPRHGPAHLQVSVRASREFVTAFVLPGDVPWPGSPEALDALIRAGFEPEPWSHSWVSEDGDSIVVPSFMSGARFDFRTLPLGHYTLFIREEEQGLDELLRIPVDLSRDGVHAVNSERPAREGGRLYTR